MDLIDILLRTGLFTALVVAYLLFIRKQPPKTKNYRKPGWNYALKRLLAQYVVKRWRAQLPRVDVEETPRVEQLDGWDDVTLRACAGDGSTILVGIRKQCVRKPFAEVTVYVKLPDATYQLPQHPETAVSAWSDIQDGWSAGGLKIQVLEPQTRLRILFNGLLTRLEDNTTRHVTFNFIWTSATSVIRHPADWSDHLAAQTLALEPWRDTFWSQMLNNCDEGGGSWMQWGVVQGRFTSHNEDGAVDRSDYLRLRGVRERTWSKRWHHLRRHVNLVVTTPDGTAIQLRAHSYKQNFTQCVSGSVRFPNFMVKSIDSSDLDLAEFCETPDEMPKNFTINVDANGRSFKIIIRINQDGGSVFHGSPHHQSLLLRVVAVNINGEFGTGILELGYASLDKSEPAVRITSEPLLKWLKEPETDEAGYCLAFENRAATCPSYVGGKGASLALLSSMQQEEGYRVPPGFCLTIRSLERHLHLNPEIKQAISDIEEENVNYNEDLFKEKCKKAADMFNATDIPADLKDDILSHMIGLRKQATEEGFGPDLRFAVRSSAVGEDSEALSAAGQNETVLGCETDNDVLRGVTKCWASMFSFTSASYRRQNGAPCLCGGGVVVQALAPARAAGVMFTRHPARGDPSRLLITANYGLGESVVSGSVEPDTFTVSRGADGKLNVAKIELGAKNERVVTSGGTVQSEAVPDSERSKPCLSVTEVLRLAHVGDSQEELWGAARDIEWAIIKDDIYLLQARPITSLERWTEEELLHELDFPIMSDEELLTFANTGEVMPKPVSPISYDLAFEPVSRGILALMASNGDGYDKTIVLTHNRAAIALYNSVYRLCSGDLDIGLRMMEMAVHGHKVADEHIISVALQRRPPRRSDRIFMYIRLVKALLSSNGAMKDTVKGVNVMNVDTSAQDPLSLLEAIAATQPEMTRYTTNHGMTTSACTFAQILAMTVLLEGRTDFTSEECNEMSTLLSSGNVLSAEIPHILTKIATKLAKTGKAEDFKNQDPEAAMDWLKYNLPPIYEEVILFLEEHGHRSVMEFDLLVKPWVLVPEEFMKALMQVRPSEEPPRPILTSNEIIASLKTPKKSSTRRVLRWVLPFCHRTVRHRESTKSHVILAVHKLRLAVLNLGQVLVQQWYLPEQDLVCFFRVHELRDYIKHRDPALLKKAMQRKQYFTKWEKLQFAEINRGWPEPIQPAAPQVKSGAVKISATSVCGGDVVARVCVVKNLSEIDQLQQRDILITHSTDIGWSPYFPLLSGIVTELGGLISHGAVIAREYGLPCIVGATGATDAFSTGDMVRLSGDCGFIQKLDAPSP